MRTVVLIEYLIEYRKWEMFGGLSGNGPLTIMLSDRSIHDVTAGLGPGYWHRIRRALEEKIGEKFPVDSWPEDVQFFLRREGS